MIKKNGGNLKDDISHDVKYILSSHRMSGVIDNEYKLQVLFISILLLFYLFLIFLKKMIVLWCEINGRFGNCIGLQYSNCGHFFLTSLYCTKYVVISKKIFSVTKINCRLYHISETIWEISCSYWFNRKSKKQNIFFKKENFFILLEKVLWNFSFLVFYFI